MKEDIAEIYSELRKTAPPMLVDRLVRAVRQEKASSAIEALEKRADATTEKLADYLEFEMASLLQDGLESGSLNKNAFVTDNRKTLRLIAKGAAIGFADMKSKESR